MSNTDLMLFAVAASLASAVLGIIIGRLWAMHGFTWTLKDAIGIALIGAFIAVLFILFWRQIPAQNEQLIVYMLGQLSGFVGGVISSHYVNNAVEEKLAGERNKTVQDLAGAVKAAAEATPAPVQNDPNAIRDGDDVTISKGD